ncbi:MAG: hypothetical protein GWP08_03210 [Nitrospiraceae bacterium]|nr:hypothetical protein [Nitrospiraceae bacterium]
MKRHVPSSLRVVLILTGLLLAGCPPVHDVSGHYQIQVNALSRSFRLFVPSSYDPARPVPLVIALHGINMTGDMLALYTGLEDYAEQERFTVVFPDGGLTMWQALPAGNSFYNSELLRRILGGYDDIAFVSALISTLSQVMNIDQTRVYVCGISNGGMMSYLTAIELSDRVAAVASIAAPMPKSYTRVSPPKHPVPLLIMHGTEDTVLPYAGGEAELSGILDLASQAGLLNLSILDFLSIDQTVAYWVDHNKTDTEAEVDSLPNTRLDDGATVVRRIYSGGEEGSEVVLYSIVGGGHTWPGAAVTVPLLSAGNTCYDVNANEVMWKFFQRFRRE